MEENPVIIGVFYEKPDGEIIYTYGYYPHPNIKDGYDISYYADHKTPQVCNKKEFQTYKLRSDLKDFPNAIDPRLPYIFDLYWDIKHTSELKKVLQRGHVDILAIKEQIVINNIVL